METVRNITEGQLERGDRTQRPVQSEPPCKAGCMPHPKGVFLGSCSRGTRSVSVQSSPHRELTRSSESQEPGLATGGSGSRSDAHLAFTLRSPGALLVRT